MIRALGACALAIWLAGCAMIPAPAELPLLQAVPAAFEMSGRLSVRVAERSEIARLRWTRRASGDLWVIASPLGNEVARIESGPGGATLTGSATESAPTFAELTRKLFGVPLEPSELAAWLHGRVPGAAREGWQVALDETQRAGNVELARRLTASRGEVVVRLVVDAYRALEE